MADTADITLAALLDSIPRDELNNLTWVVDHRNLAT